MQLIKNLANHKLAVVLCFALLICQAYCDLSLPRYTSDIVDVGIQQSGVDHVATTQLSERTYNVASLLLDGDDLALLQESYTLGEDGTYTLSDAGKQNRDALDAALSVPMLVAHPPASLLEQMGSGSSFDADQLLSAYQAGAVSKQQVAQGMEALTQALDGIDDSLLQQQAILSAQEEYTQLGYSLADIQMNYLLSTGAMMALMAAAIMAIVILVALIASRTAAKVARDLRNKFFERVLSFSDAEINSFSAASLITRGTNDIQLIQMVTSMLMRMILYAPILAIGGVIMVAVTAPSMAWVIAVAIVALFIFLGILMAITMPKFKIMQTLIDRVNLVAREILTGLPVIRAFGREAHEQERFEDASERLMRTQLFTNRVMTFMMPVMQLIMNGVSVAIIWFGGIRVSEGTLQTGDLIALITYAMVIIMGFLMLGMLAILLPRAMVAAGRVQEVIDTQSSIVDPQSPHDSELRLENPGVEVTFQDVCFAFDGDSENALEDVTFTFPAGKVGAIVGPTGSGKSTVVKLMERFYDVKSGGVLLDGVDVRELSQAAVRSQFGYVPQQSFLFSGDVRSNVGYSQEGGTAKLDDAAINRALEIAQAADFVAERPEGLSTPIAQGGTNVSGGQRQRLAIARALAADARGYLFDDSFSALDYKTDAALRAQIAQKLQGRTVIIVAQRIATIMAADHIVVLDEGRVVGQGTHAQLMATCATYQDIAHSQLSEEELEKSLLPVEGLKGGACHE